MVKVTDNTDFQEFRDKISRHIGSDKDIAWKGNGVPKMFQNNIRISDREGDLILLTDKEEFECALQERRERGNFHLKVFPVGKAVIYEFFG